MRYTIYKTTNLLNGKFYIGKHQTKNPHDSYLGSGKALVNSIKKHGRSNFSKEILFDFDNEADMNAKEAELLTEDFVSRADNYNAGIGGEGGPHFRGKKHTKEVLDRIRLTKADPEWQKRNPAKKGLVPWNKGLRTKPQKEATPSAPRVLSDETKEKLRQKQIARWRHYHEGKSGRRQMV